MGSWERGVVPQSRTKIGFWGFLDLPEPRVGPISSHTGDGWRGNDRSCRKYPTPSFKPFFANFGKRFLSFETEKVVKVASIREEFFDCYRFSLVVWVVGRLLVNQWQMVFNYQHNSSMVVIICFLLWQIASIYLFISNHKLISKAYCLYLRVPIDKPFLMNGIPRAASPFVSRGETVLLLLPARSLVTRLGLRWIGQPLQPISHRPKETNLATKKT